MRGTHKRRVSAESGHALEILGHAIDYLVDELIHDGGGLAAHKGEIEAIQLLIGRNRDLYFACPEVPSLRERWTTFIHAHFLRPGRALRARG